MESSLKHFMSTMGTGPKSSDDLGYAETRRAMAHLLDEECSPVTFGAFTVAARWKGQSPEELAGFLDQIRDEHVNYIEPDREFYLDVSGRFDGKVNSVNTELAASVLSAAAGVPVFTHSGQRVPTKEGTTVLDVLESLGLPANPSLESSREALDDVGFSYSSQAVYAPDLADLVPRRRELGVRCFLNTIESMVNPANAPVHVGSFYHLAFASRVCETFERSETQSPDGVTMIQGIEGQTELRSGDCLIAEWSDGELADHEYNSGDYDLSFTRADLEEIGPSPQTSAELFSRLIRGDSVPDPYRESVLWNTAARLIAAGESSSVEEGLDRAERVMGSEKPRDLWKAVEEVFRDE